MGRFTLRDEGKTICVGKVLKYKPYAKGVLGVGAAKAEHAADAAKTADPVKQVTQQMGMATLQPAEELVYNMETGEMTKKKPALEGIAEGEEEEGEVEATM